RRAVALRARDRLQRSLRSHRSALRETTMKILTSCLVALALSCGGSNNTQTDAPTIHEGDAAIDGKVAPDCFTGTPVTHDEIINACPAPGVTRIFKTPSLPLMNSDGTLPPLPC